MNRELAIKILKELAINSFEHYVNELNTYNTELTEQETKIDEIIELLQIKAIGESSKYVPRKISFLGYSGTELDYEFENLDASNITSLYRFVSECSNITTIDISSLTFGLINDMKYAFSSNSLATNYIFGDINTSGVESLFYTFSLLLSDRQRSHTQPIRRQEIIAAARKISGAGIYSISSSTVISGLSICAIAASITSLKL